jgi:FkbM family methyltransferase
MPVSLAAMIELQQDGEGFSTASLGRGIMLGALTKLHPRSILGALVRFPLALFPRRHVTVVRQGLNQGLRWVVGSSTHGCWLGTYEREKQALLSRLVRPGMVVWDVGANAGFYTLAFSRLVGETGRVFAFEPLAENANNLLRHLQLNQIRNARVIQAALAGDTGLTGFSIAESNAMGHISPQDGSYLVPTFTADDFLARHPEARPDLLKIDIEGAESALLSGASQLLRDVAPELVLALHGETQSHLCVEHLRSLGYSLYYLDGSPADSLPLRSDEIHARRQSAALQTEPATRAHPAHMAGR